MNSDKWCEQGGYISSVNSGTITLTFLKSFKDTDYTILKTFSTSSSNSGITYAQASFFNRTVNSAQTTTAGAGYCWMAYGYFD